MKKLFTKEPIYICWSCGDDVDNDKDIYCEICAHFIDNNLERINTKVDQFAQFLMEKK
jgi:hypothetical protein